MIKKIYIYFFLNGKIYLEARLVNCMRSETNTRETKKSPRGENLLKKEIDELPKLLLRNKKKIFNFGNTCLYFLRVLPKSKKHVYIYWIPIGETTFDCI